ncbi:MAG: nitroreductase family protein [Anaerolineae bacterium]|nr:nitroreductase family protein [Anaerolineae bacterium]
MNALADLIRSRRSIRRYQPRRIEPALLEWLCEMGGWAPSAHNRQPWRFALVTTPATQAHLARAMGERLQDDLRADGVEEAVIARDVQRSWQRITGAAALLCLCLTMQEMDRYPDPLRSAKEHLMAVQSAAMAGQNILLAAHSVGLGACWMCAPLFCPDAVRAALALPTDWQPQGLITLGYPAEEKAQPRKALPELLLWR